MKKRKYSFMTDKGLVKGEIAPGDWDGLFEMLVLQLEYCESLELFGAYEDSSDMTECLINRTIGIIEMFERVSR